MKFLFLLSFIIFFTILDKHYHYQQIKKLNTLFNNWVTSNGETERPNNALFRELYQKCYKSNEHLFQYSTRKSSNIVNVVECFPSTDPQLLSQMLPLMDNLLDFYTLEFHKTRTPIYWLHFVVFLPQKILLYLGANPDSSLGRLSNVIYWSITTLYSIYESKIIAYLSELLP